MAKPVGVIEIDHAELTVRLLEIGIGLKRPSGQSGRDALADCRRTAKGKPVNERALEDFERMAAAAVEFFGECAAKMHTSN